MWVQVALLQKAMNYILRAAHFAIDTDKNTIIALGNERSNCIRLPLVDIVEYLD